MTNTQILNALEVKKAEVNEARSQLINDQVTMTIECETPDADKVAAAHFAPESERLQADYFALQTAIKEYKKLVEIDRALAMIM